MRAKEKYEEPVKGVNETLKSPVWVKGKLRERHTNFCFLCQPRHSEALSVTKSSDENTADGFLLQTLILDCSSLVYA